ncbi:MULTISPECIES: DUF4915 domain-containing protein [unclassified Cyanobium]|uniref:DUF4915 domain-containing protein n=1 Tax=unclassified Cyanobium TaxID=2627006 RepID=UPI0020CD4A61|nr:MULTISPECIES: DUF4915 domain-containing protein [unclassified Cyanobium]MCP9861359.1 DUF4915 domain-containing protein [Cyanobium sp. Cruz-8H5]MCP9868593.1 DUF4915 domain-containing protein [Cyanobium sp. Cruz-8D1]
MTSPAQPPPAPELKPVDVRYEHSQSLPALLEHLDLSVLLSTYQAGRVVSVGSHRGDLRLGFSRFDQAMGLSRTASGIAVGTRDAIWTLPANLEIAAYIQPEGEHDIAFLARSCHHSGPLMGHDLAWGCERLWESLSHRPRTEVLMQSDPRNPRCWLEAGLWTVGVIHALARLLSSLEKALGWLLPPPASTG